MWEIEKGKSNLVFEVVRKDSYATVSKMVDEVRMPGLVIAVHDSRYLRKIIRTESIETKVIYEDKTEVIDPRVLRDKTVMAIQEFLAGHEEGVMLVDVLEELGKRLSIPEMEKTVKTLASFKSCKHTILATLNPVVLPKDMVKAITPMFDSVQDVRAASMGGEHVDCPNCGA
ncbi:MAG: hypothetical protein QCI38_03560, partial [Candidatus Thermoplasmatota archaeon]|nr:hypothetical protein [Candidatus Thermoplasmatota archaeon]